MKNNYFKEFRKKMEGFDLRGAGKMLEKGAQAYTDHLNLMLAGGIDGEEAGLILAAMRPLIKVLEGLDGAAEAEALITELYSPAAVCISHSVEEEEHT